MNRRSLAAGVFVLVAAIQTAASVELPQSREAFVTAMAGGARGAATETLFTLQVVHQPRGLGHAPPPGGLYVMAADIRSPGAGRIEIALYRPTMGFKKITNALKQWVEGERAACPRLP